MAPRVSKAKAPAKSVITATDPAVAGASTAAEDLGGDLHDIYNDILSAKIDLLASVPGPGRRQAMTELGRGLVCTSFVA